MLRGPNPEYLAFALEMSLGAPADLFTPVMQRIAAVWRGPWSGATAFEDRLFATMRAAESECPGLWLAITQSVVEQLDYQDALYRRHFSRAVGEVEALDSETLRTARRRTLARQIHAYHRLPS
ncbi:hypothetical protein OJ996_20490 [Luteolibacter sp. GHJ8]|uniref:Uncharacterized protein n=2 Tax=Luteolibacter rhizosphaerae TaxID=2989719 RepID=A0ABT3G800_9BACT|nr:hypothetical protein [Luteolibacter rhizosphaerae]